MTIIVWDGKTLAADKMASSNGYGLCVTKIFRIPGAIVGMSGDGPVARELLEWLKDGAEPSKFPKSARESSAELLAIDSAGRALGYSSTPYPMEYENNYVAIGCGSNFALAALHLGCDAVKAVQVACDLDQFCGNGIDTLTP